MKRTDPVSNLFEFGDRICLDLVGIRNNRPNNLIKTREAEALQASRAISKERAYATSSGTVENSPILQYRFELAFEHIEHARKEKKKKESKKLCAN